MRLAPKSRQHSYRLVTPSRPKGDWDPEKDKAGMAADDLPAFVAALAAMAAGGNKTNKLVAEGHFFLSDSLVLTQTVVLQGTGQNEPPLFFVSSRSTPGTMLVFPKNVTGIRIRGGSRLDNPTKTFGSPFPPSGEKTILRDLTVYCKDTKGMKMPVSTGQPAMQALESRVQLAQKRKSPGDWLVYPRNGQAQKRSPRILNWVRPYPHAQSSSSGTQQDHMKKCQIALNLRTVSIPARK